MDRSIPTFDGQPIFGALGNVTTARFAGKPVDVDTYLGFVAGTTLVVEGLCYTVTATLTGPDSGTVQSAMTLLQSYSSTNPILLTAPVVRDSGLPWPADVETVPNCYFLPNELVSGSVTGPTNGLYSQPYQLLIRTVSKGVN